jgi:ribonuclease R
MKDHVGEKFTGTVSGLSDFGIFVELDESHCEGMIRLREINDDVYFFDSDNYRIQGHNTGQTIHLGDSVTVLINSADLVNKKLDFDLIDVTPLK